jgi:hypothetical protein
MQIRTSNPILAEAGRPTPSGGTTLIARRLKPARELTSLSAITWELIVARRREAQLRNRFLKTILRLAEAEGTVLQ